MARAHAEILRGDSWDAFVHLLQPDSDHWKRQDNILRLLTNTVRKILSPWEASCIAYGSGANGFSEPGSDLDVCVVTEEMSQADLAGFFRQLRNQLRNVALIKQFLISARVPLVTLEFWGRTVDVTASNKNGIINTELLYNYSLMHTCVRPMVLFFKRFCKLVSACGAAFGNFSSYSLTLMVIFFLQQVPAGRYEGLPLRSLQKRGGEDTAPEEKYFRRVTEDERFYGKVDLGKLMPDLFDFYLNHINWSLSVVSIRTGRDLFEERGPGRIFSIEDPFESGRNLRNTQTPPGIDRLWYALDFGAKTAYEWGEKQDNGRLDYPEAFLQEARRALPLEGSRKKRGFA